MIAMFRAWAKPVIRSILRRDAKLKREFMSAHNTWKLHIGCGDHLVQGWLNGDVAPYWNAIKLDATRRFPFEARHLRLRLQRTHD